jgi:hypothetical protein
MMTMPWSDYVTHTIFQPLYTLRFDVSDTPSDVGILGFFHASPSYPAFTRVNENFISNHTPDTSLSGFAGVSQGGIFTDPFGVVFGDVWTNSYLNDIPNANIFYKISVPAGLPNGVTSVGTVDMDVEYTAYGFGGSIGFSGPSPVLPLTVQVDLLTDISGAVRVVTTDTFEMPWVDNGLVATPVSTTLILDDPAITNIDLSTTGFAWFDFDYVSGNVEIHPNGTSFGNYEFAVFNSDGTSAGFDGVNNGVGLSDGSITPGTYYIAFGVYPLTVADGFSVTAGGTTNGYAQLSLISF